MIDNGPIVGLRVDVTARIGAGHAIRCLSIARALNARRARTIFFVSCDESAAFFHEEGFDSVVLGGDETDLTADDAERLGSALKGCGASSVLIDSYGVDGGFFDAVSDGALGEVGIVYIDDLYTFAQGILDAPIMRPVDAVVNFNIFADEEIYRLAYHGCTTQLMLGTRFAPLRSEFAKRRKAPYDGNVSNILVTTGSTNPSRILERLSEICLEATDGARVHVVVGPKADYDDPLSDRIVTHRGESMADLMSLCQMAVAAAGVTLLELATIGVPTLAVGVVENQYQDIRVYERMGLGLGCYASDADKEIAGKVSRLFDDGLLRASFSRICCEAVDGKGADRIASAVLNLSKGKR